MYSCKLGGLLVLLVSVGIIAQNIEQNRCWTNTNLDSSRNRDFIQSTVREFEGHKST